MLRFLYSIWQHVFSGPRTVKLNKLMFDLSLRGLGILNYQSRHLSGESDWLQRYLSPLLDPIIFDVGANVGNYTAEVFTVNSSARVYAFEPHPKNIEQLTQLLGPLLAGGGDLSVTPAAVGDSSGRLDLYDRRESDGSSHASLYQKVIEDIHHTESVKRTVDVITLDDFCAEHGIDHIDLLKIDTEGNELKCLLGASQLLANRAIDAIQFEFNEMNIVSHATFKDFWDLLRDYSFARLLPRGRLLPIQSYSPLVCEIYAYQNIIAVRNGLPISK